MSVAMLVFCVFCTSLVLSFWNANFALKFLKASDSIFVTNEAPEPKMRKNRREYISAFIKKDIAAKQKWKCSCGCGQLLTAAYELDHTTPLWMGGTNKPSNLTAMNPTCHARKTAAENQRRVKGIPR